MTSLPARDAHGRLLPGHSANPDGRPKVAAEVKALAKAAAPCAMERLIELTESEDEKVAMAAASAVLDRAIGKPKQGIEKTVDHNVRFNFLDALRAANERADQQRRVIDITPAKIAEQIEGQSTTGESPEW